MDPTVNRYEDKHVRADDSLRLLAMEYLWNYHGDFLFLIEMKHQVVHQQLPLSVPQARGVLNCMRSDPNVLRLPEPRGQVLEFKPRRKQQSSQPRRIELDCTWPKPFGISNHNRAARIHILDQRQCYVTYWTDYRRPYEDRFDVRLRWLCSAHLPWVYKPGTGKRVDYDVELLTLTDIGLLTLHNEAIRMCPTCLKVAQKRGINAHEVQG